MIECLEINECYGVIYKITNTINNKIYIGQTTQSIKKRFTSHLSANYFKKMPLHRAIKKYGRLNFVIEVIDYADGKESLNTKEIFYIKLYNSIHHDIGYNAVMGGTGFYNTEETEKKRVQGIKKAKKGKYPEAFKKYKESIKGTPLTEEQKLLLSTLANDKKKKIEAINSKTNEILYFDSCVAASKYFKCPKQVISRACLKVRAHHRGWIFNYIEGSNGN